MPPLHAAFLTKQPTSWQSLPTSDMNDLQIEIHQPIDLSLAGFWVPWQVRESIVSCFCWGPTSISLMILISYIFLHFFFGSSWNWSQVARSCCQSSKVPSNVTWVRFWNLGGTCITQSQTHMLQTSQGSRHVLKSWKIWQLVLDPSTPSMFQTTKRGVALGIPHIKWHTNSWAELKGTWFRTTFWGTENDGWTSNQVYVVFRWDSLRCHKNHKIGIGLFECPCSQLGK